MYLETLIGCQVPFLLLKEMSVSNNTLLLGHISSCLDESKASSLAFLLHTLSSMVCPQRCHFGVAICPHRRPPWLPEHGPGTRMEEGAGLLTLPPVPPGECVHPLPTTSNSAFRGPALWVGGVMLPGAVTRVSVKFRLLLGPSGFLALTGKGRSHLPGRGNCG